MHNLSVLVNDLPEVSTKIYTRVSCGEIAQFKQQWPIGDQTIAQFPPSVEMV